MNDMAITLQKWLKAQVTNDVEGSVWYRSAPVDLRKKMKVRFVGVEKRRFSGLGSSVLRSFVNVLLLSVKLATKPRNMWC